MALTSDALLERSRLKRQLRSWRGATLLLGALLLFALLAVSTGADKFGAPVGDHIARITVDGLIIRDVKREKRINRLIEDDSVKAVILHVDSPGGTTTGGETLYLMISRLAEEKPVVVVMNDLATSAAYLISLPADHIIARNATITGSIGVMVQVPNFSKLAKDIGVDLELVTTGEYKGKPTFTDPMDGKTRTMLQSVVNDFHSYFVETVAKHRELKESAVRKLADGRVYSGKQALENKLVDAIGGEADAIAWLQEHKNIQKDTPIKTIKLTPSENPLEMLTSSVSRWLGFNSTVSLDGMVSIWQ